MKPLNQWNFRDVIEFAKGVDKKTWVKVISGLVVFLIALVFFIIPAWIERPLLRSDIETMQAQIRQVNGLSQKRLLWEENQKIFGSLIEDAHARVFTEDELGGMMGYISKMASESRVDVLSSKPLDEKVLFAAPYHLKYQPRGYEIVVQGGYHDLGKFSSRIEGHGKLLRIRSLQIQPSVKTPERHVAGLKLWAILTPSAGVVAPAPVGGVIRAKK